MRPVLNRIPLINMKQIVAENTPQPNRIQGHQINTKNILTTLCHIGICKLKPKMNWNIINYIKATNHIIRSSNIPDLFSYPRFIFFLSVTNMANIFSFHPLKLPANVPILWLTLMKDEPSHWSPLGPITPCY